MLFLDHSFFFNDKKPLFLSSPYIRFTNYKPRFYKNQQLIQEKRRLRSGVRIQGRIKYSQCLFQFVIYFGSFSINYSHTVSK